MDKLSGDDLVKLIPAVFPPDVDDRQLAILVDVPRDPEDDNDDWRTRREIAQDWYQALAHRASELDLEAIHLVAYPDVGSNNADLPEFGFLMSDGLPLMAEGLHLSGERVPFTEIFEQFQLYMAPTEYSTTAPLKNAARQYNFRAATMPGFSPKMLPALRIDYNEVNRRVMLIKEKLDRALWAKVDFLVDGEARYNMLFDLRYRPGHASSGRFPTRGLAGNLPSGETYIVPYEGEKGEMTQTAGILPVQLGEDVVCFNIEENMAISVDGEGETRQLEEDHLRREPAYGNMAELGFGILNDFGLEPIGEILLDEKLGFHIAFGRSDHFGGQVGPGDFSSPAAVIHLDQIYIPSTQPRVLVTSIVLGYKDDEEQILVDGNYIIF